jgi:hypothetical protein
MIIIRREEHSRIILQCITSLKIFKLLFQKYEQ